MPSCQGQYPLSGAGPGYWIYGGYIVGPGSSVVVVGVVVVVFVVVSGFGAYLFGVVVVTGAFVVYFTSVVVVTEPVVVEADCLVVVITSGFGPYLLGVVVVDDLVVVVEYTEDVEVVGTVVSETPSLPVRALFSIPEIVFLTPRLQTKLDF